MTKIHYSSGTYYPVDIDAMPEDTTYILYDDEKEYMLEDIPPEAFDQYTIRVPGAPRIQHVVGFWPTDGSTDLTGREAIIASIHELKASQ